LNIGTVRTSYDEYGIILYTRDLYLHYLDVKKP